MDKQELASNAAAIVAPGKGILAADESSGTIKKRFDSINVESTEENRLSYREMLFRTKGAAEFISGVILYDETIRQNSGLDGTPLVKVLQDQGIMPGIKVDKSTNPLAGSRGELITDGLDGLRDRLAEYYQIGARFTKWRAVITIGDGIPTDYCIEANAYAQLARQGVDLEGSLLKPNMVLSGKDASNRAGAEEVAEKTITCFNRAIPAAVPGVVFLSGGQSDEEATVNLNAINQLAAKVGVPWQTSFSYGRGLQAAPLKAWGGEAANLEKASQAYYERARVTGAARRGEYSSAMERDLAAD